MVCGRERLCEFVCICRDTICQDASVAPIPCVPCACQLPPSPPPAANAVKLGLRLDGFTDADRDTDADSGTDAGIDRDTDTHQTQAFFQEENVRPRDMKKTDLLFGPANEDTRTHDKHKHALACTNQ